MDEHAQRILGDTMLLSLNQSIDTIGVTLPEHAEDEHWELVLYTADPPPEKARSGNCDAYQLRPHLSAVFKARKRDPEETLAAA